MGKTVARTGSWLTGPLLDQQHRCGLKQKTMSWVTLQLWDVQIEVGLIIFVYTFLIDSYQRQGRAHTTIIIAEVVILFLSLKRYKNKLYTFYEVHIKK